MVPCLQSSRWVGRQEVGVARFVAKQVDRQEVGGAILLNG